MHDGRKSDEQEDDHDQEVPYQKKLSQGRKRNEIHSHPFVWSLRNATSSLSGLEIEIEPRGAADAATHGLRLIDVIGV